MQGRSSGPSRAESLPRRRWQALDDDYELLGELGRGGMADVYRAQDRRTGAQLAVKIIHARTLEDEDALARFAREARTAARLDHPNIVSVIASRELEDGSLALVMPYIPGETLRDSLRRRGALHFSEVEQILRDVGAALASAHATGIVHRDVKPENIFLDSRDGRALLSDFGIARSIDSETLVTRTGMAIGTPAYMSPEQIEGHRVDGQSDVYSLGLVGWEMVSGTRPWEGESLYSVIYRQVNDDLPPLRAIRPETPPHLALAIDGALAKDRSVRWTGALELLAQLDHPGGPLPTERAERIARLSATRLEPTPPATVPTVAFRRPDADDYTALTEADMALVRPRRGARWAVVPLVLAVVAIAAFASREGSTSMRRTPASSSSVADTALARQAPVAAMPAETLAIASTGAESAAVALSSDSVRALVERQVAESLAARERPTEESAAGMLGDAPPTALTVPRATAPARSTPATSPTAPPPSPARVPPPVVGPPAAARSVAAGGLHSCYVTAAGELFCWGGNDRGQLGMGATSRQSEPIRVASAVRFRSVSAGVAHSCAVAAGGGAYCWGANEQGQLGDGTTTARVIPARVAGGQEFLAVHAGMSHSCGLTTSGQVYCWGANASGQLGTGTTAGSTRPVRVIAAERFATLSVGWNHSCAITSSGRALCWGQNSGGQLGDGTTESSAAPREVSGGLHFEAIAAGGTHTCALTEDGGAYCWGRNGSGQLGDGSTEDRSEPVRVAGDSRFQAITAGSVHSCALTSGGQGYCWGRNSYGQLGDGGTTSRATPARVAGGHAFSNIGASGAHTCALTGSGESFCWGYNVEGQLGDGTRTHRTRPVYVDKPSS